LISKFCRWLSKTTVFGYVGFAADGTLVPHSPGPFLPMTVNQPTSVLSFNELTAPHFLPVDPTLPWANPTSMRTPVGPFLKFPSGYSIAQTNVATVPHLHGAEVSALYDGHPDAWITSSGRRGTLFASSAAPPSNNSRV
jgi:spore coat protein A